MPNRLILEVGSNIVVLPLKGSNAVINGAIKRFVLRSGGAVDGRTAMEIGTDALALILAYVKDTSKTQQREELLGVQRAALETQLGADNDL